MQRIQHTCISTLLGLFLCAAFPLKNYAQQPYVFADSSHLLPVITQTSNTMDVYIVDIDMDGDNDIILANEFQRNIVLKNDGNGHFTDVSNNVMGNFNHDSEDITVADFDGDNFMDIIIVSEDDSVHEYYLNNMFNNFTDVSSRLPVSIANAVAAGELNGDGKIDLVIGNAGQDFILINTGQGYFADETLLRMPVNNNITQDVKLIDVDADGDLDILMGNEDGNKIYINNGFGHFTDETLARFPQMGNMETRKIEAGDIDNDGDLDLFLSNVRFIFNRDPQNRLYINDGNGYFTDVSLDQFPEDIYNTTDGIFTDLNNDGSLDLILVNYPNTPVEVFLNFGGYFYESTTDILPPFVFYYGLAIVSKDLNGDGWNDLYLGSRGGPDKLLFRIPETQSIDQPLASDILEVRPGENPGIFQLVFHQPLYEKTTVSIVDLQGKTLFQRAASGVEMAETWNIDLTVYPPAVYILMVNGEQLHFSQKIFKLVH